MAPTLRTLPIFTALVLAACGGGDAPPTELPQEPPKTLVVCGEAKKLTFPVTAFDANFLGRVGAVDALPVGLYRLAAEFYTAPALNSEVYVQVTAGDGRVLAEAFLPVAGDGLVVLPGVTFSLDSSAPGVTVFVRLTQAGVIQKQLITVSPCTQKSAVL